MENGTWELVKKSERVKPVFMKWVYGCAWECGAVQVATRGKKVLAKQEMDLEEVNAPLSKHTTLRALLAVVAKCDLELH